MKAGILATALLGTACAPQLAATQTACKGAVDIVYINGRIWTAETAQPWAEALAVAGDKLACVGTTDAIRQAAGSTTTVVDLQGRFVAPGFQDSHLHLPGPSLNSVPLEDVTSVAELQAKLKAFADANPDLPWITGRGWGYAIFPDAKADRSYIDAVISDRPVYITMRDGHAGLGNSAALAALKITSATANPPNGQIVKDAAGRPTGEFTETAHGMASGLIPPETTDARYATLIANMADAASQGLTAVHVAGASPEELSLFERALKADALKVRMHVAVRMIPRIGRAGIRNVQLRHPKENASLDDLDLKMDLVMIDAPCTGVGTWRRKPDAKWRVQPNALAKRIQDQGIILRTACNYVKPGGRLVYVTCSFLMEENEDQVASFRADRLDFIPDDAADAAVRSGQLTEFGAKLVRKCRRPDGSVRLTPRTAGTDGFYMAVMRRAG